MTRRASRANCWASAVGWTIFKWLKAAVLGWMRISFSIRDSSKRMMSLIRSEAWLLSASSCALVIKRMSNPVWLAINPPSCKANGNKVIASLYNIKYQVWNQNYRWKMGEINCGREIRRHSPQTLSVVWCDDGLNERCQSENLKTALRSQELVAFGPFFGNIKERPCWMKVKLQLEPDGFDNPK